MNLNAKVLLKGTVGMGGSAIATLFSTGMDDAFREISVILGIVVAILTALNLAWSFWAKCAGRTDEAVAEAIKEIKAEIEGDKK